MVAFTINFHEKLCTEVAMLFLGIFIFGDQDEQFEKRVESMKSLLMKRLNVYNSEEKTLVVMLEEEKEQLQREDDTKRKKLMEKGDFIG